VSYTAAERRTLQPVRREAEKQALSHPERRDLFLCHAWDDRLGAAKEFHELLESPAILHWQTAGGPTKLATAGSR
jgi:hypothetical protein